MQFTRNPAVPPPDFILYHPFFFTACFPFEMALWLSMADVEQLLLWSSKPCKGSAKDLVQGHLYNIDSYIIYLMMINNNDKQQRYMKASSWIYLLDFIISLSIVVFSSKMFPAKWWMFPYEGMRASIIVFLNVFNCFWSQIMEKEN